MAYDVSENFRTSLYNGNSDYDCRLFVNGNRVPVEQISNIKISSPIVDTTSETGTQFHLGTFISQSVTIKFRNLNGLDLTSNPEIYLEIGLKVNGQYEYVPIGYYMIDELSENYQTTCEITCLDYAVKMKSNIDISKFFNDDNYIYALDLLRTLCDYYGLTLGDYPRINNDKKITQHDSSLSGKTYVSYLAELFGGNAKIGRNKTLNIIPLNTPIEKRIPINALISKDFKVGQEYYLSRVVYDNTIVKYQFGGDVITVDELPIDDIDFTSIYYLTSDLKYYKYKEEEREWEEDTTIKNTLYLRTENIFITQPDEVENIYEQVKDFAIHNITCENRGDLSLDSWDIIEYSLDDKKYLTFNDNEITFNGTSMSKVNTNIPTGKKGETTNVIGESSITQRLKVMRTTIDEQKGEIETLIASQKDISDNINKNYYTITQTQKLIQNSNEGVTNVFSEAGGNNIFRNTGLWFEGDKSKTQYLYPRTDLYPSNETYLIEDSTYEYWSGYAKRIPSNLSANGNSILMQQGIFLQEQNVPNGNYTISFKYKKLNSFVYANVEINGNTYDLGSLDWKEFYTGEKDENDEYITLPIEVQSGHISIAFYCDTNDGLEVYDIMCNKGTVKLAWSQNENEVTTDTVNISKGITIISSNLDTKFKADADGIRVLNKNTDELITDFTDKGTTTKELVVKEQANICGTLITEVGNQTWFTRM